MVVAERAYSGLLESLSERWPKYTIPHDDLTKVTSFTVSINDEWRYAGSFIMWDVFRGMEGEQVLLRREQKAESRATAKTSTEGHHDVIARQGTRNVVSLNRFNLFSFSCFLFPKFIQGKIYWDLSYTNTFIKEYNSKCLSSCQELPHREETSLRLKSGATSWLVRSWAREVMRRCVFSNSISAFEVQ